MRPLLRFRSRRGGPGGESGLVPPVGGNGGGRGETTGKTRARLRRRGLTGGLAVDGRMHEREIRLYELVEPTVGSLGFDLVGVLWRDGCSRSLVRIYIDKDEGVTVDDCARVSHRINGLLDVEDPIPGGYDLEVSSPGVDRPLFVERDFARHAGAGLQVTLRSPFAGRRRFTGTLGGYADGVVLVDEHGMEHRFAISEIETARLVPHW